MEKMSPARHSTPHDNLSEHNDATPVRVRDEQSAQARRCRNHRTPVSGATIHIELSAYRRGHHLLHMVWSRGLRRERRHALGRMCP